MALVLLLAARTALACGLCGEPAPSVQRTIREAALVAVVTSTGDATGTHRTTPWTTLAVEHVLKGRFEGKTLTARAWMGMCPYGFVLEPGTYLAFFEKTAEGWSPVRQGCAPKALPVTDGLVDAGKKRIKPEALVRRSRAR
jgi:hypothetical protein